MLPDVYTLVIRNSLLQGFNFGIGWYCIHAFAPSQFGRFLTLCNNEEETTIYIDPRFL